jgi:hypothetical protein
MCTYELHEAPLDPELLQRIEPIYRACFDRPARTDLKRAVPDKPRAMLLIASEGGRAVGYKLGYALAEKTFYSWLGRVDSFSRRLLASNGFSHFRSSLPCNSKVPRRVSA